MSYLQSRTGNYDSIHPIRPIYISPCLQTHLVHSSRGSVRVDANISLFSRSIHISPSSNKVCIKVCQQSGVWKDFPALFSTSRSHPTRCTSRPHSPCSQLSPVWPSWHWHLTPPLISSGTQCPPAWHLNSSQVRYLMGSREGFRS